MEITLVSTVFVLTNERRERDSFGHLKMLEFGRNRVLIQTPNLASFLCEVISLSIKDTD